jgi:predicted phage terminase large subunit-like protein
VKVTAEVVEGFVKSLLLPKFDGAAEIPDCHREWWSLCCSTNKYVAIAAPRGFAKSTAITLSYLLAKLCFRESQFAIIVSDTEAQSILFLNDIKREMTENEHLVKMFAIKGLEKDSETDIIVSFEDGHLCRIMAKGSEQKLRGLKWHSKRPDLVVCDDIENDELVMNKERREKFQRWFNSALIPILSDRGIIRVVGTILHNDSLLEGFMPKERDKYSIVEPLKLSATHYRGWIGVKYAAHNKDFSKLLWSAKKSKEDLQALRDLYESKGQLDSYSQEMLNRPIDESNTHFRRSDFLDLQPDDRSKRLTYYITMDLAVTTKSVSDYSVFMVSGMDSDGYVHVRHVIKDRLDSLEIIEVLGQLVKTYDPVMVVTEKGIIVNSLMPAIHRWMDENNLYFRFELLASTVDKLQRSQAIRLRARAGRVKIDKSADWWPDLEEELMQFPRSAHDDQVDAFSLIGQVLNKFNEAPTEKEVEEEAYEQEKKDSGVYEQGRCELTGY